MLFGPDGFDRLCDGRHGLGPEPGPPTPLALARTRLAFPGEKNRAENLRFRRWIKSHTFVERQFRRAAEGIEEQMDCQACAECCRVTEVQLVERDVDHLARYLGLPR